MKILPRFWYALAFFVGLIGLNLLFHQLILERLAALFSSLIVVGIIWAALSLRGIRFERKSLYSRYECGEVFEEKYEILNDSILPKLWIRVEDASRLPSKPASRTVTQVRPHDSMYFQALAVLSRRGEFPLGPTVLHSGDPFGFFSQEKVVEPQASILVLPLVFPMEGEWNPKGDLSGGRAHRENKSLSSLNATAVRDYQPGDALNKIHWKTSVRAQKWMVKEFEQEPLANIWIILDSDDANYFIDPIDVNSDLLLPRDVRNYEPEQELPRDNFEYAVSVTATLIHFYLGIGRGVGLLFSGESPVSIAPEKGTRQRTILLESLAYVQTKKQTPLLTVVQSQSAKISKGNSVVLVSSNLGKELTGAINTLKRKGINCMLVFIDPLSFGEKEKNKHAINSIFDLGIPLLIVKYGDDPGKVLTGVT